MKKHQDGVNSFQLWDFDLSTNASICFRNYSAFFGEANMKKLGLHMSGEIGIVNKLENFVSHCCLDFTVSSCCNNSVSFILLPMAILDCINRKVFLLSY